MGDLDSIPGLGRSPKEGKGYPLQDSGLENSMVYAVNGVTKSRTQLSNFHFTSLHWGLPWWSSGEDFICQCRGLGSIPDWGIKIPKHLAAKNQKFKQEQYCNKFFKDFKKTLIHIKK